MHRLNIVFIMHFHLTKSTMLRPDNTRASLKSLHRKIRHLFPKQKNGVFDLYRDDSVKPTHLKKTCQKPVFDQLQVHPR